MTIDEAIYEPIIRTSGGATGATLLVQLKHRDGRMVTIKDPASWDQDKRFIVILIDVKGNKNFLRLGRGVDEYINDLEDFGYRRT